MRATLATVLGIALLGVTFTSVFAAGQGNRQGQGRRQQPDACQLAVVPVTTIKGTIRDLALPEAGSREGPARFTLVSGDTATAVRLGPPHALAAAGVTLAEGDAVTVIGWSVTRDGDTWLIPRDLTVKGTTVALRDADGTPTWQSRRGNGQGQGQGAGRGNGQRKRDGSGRNQASIAGEDTQQLARHGQGNGQGSGNGTRDRKRDGSCMTTA